MNIRTNHAKALEALEAALQDPERDNETSWGVLKVALRHHLGADDDQLKAITAKILYTEGEFIVRSVNGQKVRRDINIDFVSGGHYLVYDYIPEKELWIDSELPPQEEDFITIHEVHECYLMQSGLSYDDAHAQASKIEHYYRETPKGLKEKIKEELKRIAGTEDIKPLKNAIKMLATDHPCFNEQQMLEYCGECAWFRRERSGTAPYGDFEVDLPEELFCGNPKRSDMLWGEDPRDTPCTPTEKDEEGPIDWEFTPCPYYKDVTTNYELVATYVVASQIRSIFTPIGDTKTPPSQEFLDFISDPTTLTKEQLESAVSTIVTSQLDIPNDKFNEIYEQLTLYQNQEKESINTIREQYESATAKPDMPIEVWKTITFMDPQGKLFEVSAGPNLTGGHSDVVQYKHLIPRYESAQIFESWEEALQQIPTGSYPIELPMVTQ